MARDLVLEEEIDQFDFDGWGIRSDQSAQRADSAALTSRSVSTLSQLSEQSARAAEAVMEGRKIDPGGDAIPLGDDIFDKPGLSADISAAAAPTDRYVSSSGQNVDASGEYNIELVFKGDWPDELRADFQRAADYISSIIQGDLADVGDVDDLRISAELQSIDGQNGTLAYAGPTSTRGNGLSSEGQMVFDSADAQSISSNGTFDDLVLHEMMHCVGIGTLWDSLTEGSVASGDMRFTGENAKAAYEAVFPEIAGNDPSSDRGVPIETDGQPGTAGGHWDEDTFQDEVMTGYIDQSNFFSGMTAAALEDMGYDTIFDPANPGASMPTLGDQLLLA
ncbi:leishmanolysin-related zinc metalloendopeptidase [Paracoccus fistulariae]|uniref:Leishmanolysin n=1 Tax=Paracoccus fistulariae TaxID=658446 RepID=A0ABY7SH11_9RHOB|nr:leishmanolysin-related zinc metalloendopeptidase [Paracoccus fistulariae]MDB6181006.1 leishmanolysin-related zinc metalloendopeptidase [Paracoccus fistulariae]WCR06302.1 hypothetical protein JHX87_12450 [Paracoccus fistulariae]